MNSNNPNKAVDLFGAEEKKNKKLFLLLVNNRGGEGF